jgi:HEAT repeat protein
LLRLEQHRQRGPQLAMAANGGSLLRRVRRLLVPTDAPHDARGRWAAMPLGMGALVGLASWVTTDIAGVPTGARTEESSAIVASADTIRAATSRNARPDTVVVYGGASAALDSRWDWAEGAARRSSAPAIWIGYRIAGDATRGFAYLDHRVPVYTGNSTMMGSMRFKGTTSGMTFLGVRMDSLVGAAPPEDQVVLLGFARRSGRLELDRVHASTFVLPVHFGGRPLYWLGEAEDEESVELVRRMYGSSAEKELRGELIDVVGLHVSERPVLRAIEAWLASGQEAETRRNAAEQLGNLESTNALALAARVARQDRARDVRREAAEAIGEMRATGALDTLGALARSLDDREVRKEAVEALGERPEPEAARMLVRLAWDDADQEVQKEAVESLGETHSPQAASELARIAREHPRTEVRREAVETLGELDEPSTVLPLLSDIVEHNSSSEVRQEAIETLGELKTDAAHRAVRNYARSSSDAEVRRQAIEVLAEDGDSREAHDILRAIIREGTEPDQEKAVERLAEVEDPRVVASLHEIAVTHSSESVRHHAIEALSETKAKGEALDAISRLVWRGKDPASEKRAVEALAEMEGDDVVDSLVKIAEKHPATEVRHEAVERLGNVEHDPRALSQLARLTRLSGDESIAKAAIEAYANSARPAEVIALVKSVLNSSKSEEMLEAALDALANIDDNAGIPAMIDIASTHPNRELRKRAIEQLGESDDPRAHAALAKLLESGR